MECPKKSMLNISEDLKKGAIPGVLIYKAVALWRFFAGLSAIPGRMIAFEF